MTDKPKKPAMVDPIGNLRCASREEEALMVAIIVSFQRPYAEFKEDFLPTLLEYCDTKELANSNLMDLAKLNFLKGIRAAPRLNYYNGLMRAAKKAETEGTLTADDVQVLDKAFAVRPLTASRVTMNTRLGANGKIDYLEYILADDDFHEMQDFPRTTACLEDILKRTELSPAARDLATDMLVAKRPVVEAYDRAVSVIGSEKSQKTAMKTAFALDGDVTYAEAAIINCMRTGSLYHKGQAAFADASEKASFASMLAEGLHKLVINQGDHHMPLASIQAATLNFAERVAKHDRPVTRVEAQSAERAAELAANREKLAAQGAAKLDAETRRERERLLTIQKTLDRALKEQANARQAAYDAFMAEPQPYVLDAAADRVVRVLETQAASMGKNALPAQIILDAIEKAKPLLDRRDTGLSELGAQLLSPASLHSAVHAMGLEDSIRTIPRPAEPTLGDRSKRLRLQYNTSEAIEHAVDTMLADNQMALLVALQTRTAAQCKAYATDAKTVAANLHTLDEDPSRGINALKRTIGTEEEVQFLLSDETLRDSALDRLRTKLAERAAEVEKLSAKRRMLTVRVRQSIPPHIVANGEAEGEDAAQKTLEVWRKFLDRKYQGVLAIQPSEQGEGWIKVASVAHPEMATDLRQGVPHEEFVKAATRLAAQHANHEGHQSGTIEVQKTGIDDKVPAVWRRFLDAEYNGQFDFQESPRGEKWVAVRTIRHPDITTELKLNASEEEFVRGVADLSTQSAGRDANRKLAKGLNKEMGFNLSTGADGTMVLRHPEYDITVPLNGPEEERTRALTGAMVGYTQKQYEQGSMLKTLEMLGIGVHKSTAGAGKGISLRLPDDSHIALASRGYFSAEDFSLANGVLGLFGKTEGNGEEHRETRKVSTSNEWVWRPGKEDSAILLDANVIKRLAVPRNGNPNETWLALFKETARHTPVIVTERVYFEMTGKMPALTQNGGSRKYRQADESVYMPDSNRAQSAALIEQWLADGAYGEIENGAIKLRGSPGRIIVASVPQDAEFYKQIQTKVLDVIAAEFPAVHAIKSEDLRRARLYRMRDLFVQHIYGKGAGEDSIVDVIHNVPEMGVWDVGTDDRISFVKTSEAPRRTASNRPVLYNGTGAYLDAEINAAPDHYMRLSRLYSGATPLSCYAIEDAIVRAGGGLGKFGDAVLQYSTHATHPETGKDITIASIIRENVEKMLRGQGEGAASAGWTARNAISALTAAERILGSGGRGAFHR